MALFKTSERKSAEAIAGIGYCNPFLPERIALEQQVLGADYIPSPAVMHWRPTLSPADDYPNFPRLRDRADRLADTIHSRLLSDASHSEDELRMYEDIVLYLLYARYMPRLDEWLAGAPKPSAVRPIWLQFATDFAHFLHVKDCRFPSQHDPSHAFAVLAQLHRAFTSIYECIIGSSMAIARLRAAVWQSIFSHDMRRYGRVLYRCIGDVATLILGPSGTGKELVAQAIGHARYVRFDPVAEEFAADDLNDFHPLNLSALAPTLIESELFGHRRGAFSGAVGDRIGWLESCGPSGTVFLDEIGDLEAGMQIKLLRVLQSREFQRVGETIGRTFRGKIVAATNRDLAAEIQQGRFRDDLYFRLCADIVRTPTLKEQLSESPGDLVTLVEFLTQRIIPDDPAESSLLAGEVVAWIESQMQDKYDWPGNIRELEQCVRNVMIHGSYDPPRDARASRVSRGKARLAALVCQGELNMEDLIRHYTSLAFAMQGNYVSAAKLLQVNWRTVREKIDSDLVAEYRDDLSN